MPGAGEDDQSPVRGDLLVQFPSLVEGRQVVAAAGEDQHGDVLGDAGDRRQGGDLVDVGQEDGRDEVQTRIGGEVQHGGQPCSTRFQTAARRSR